MNHLFQSITHTYIWIILFSQYLSKSRMFECILVNIISLGSIDIIFNLSSVHKFNMVIVNRYSTFPLELTHAYKIIASPLNSSVSFINLFVVTFAICFHWAITYEHYKNLNRTLIIIQLFAHLSIIIVSVILVAAMLLLVPLSLTLSFNRIWLSCFKCL